MIRNSSLFFTRFSSRKTKREENHHFILLSDKTLFHHLKKENVFHSLRKKKNIISAVSRIRTSFNFLKNFLSLRRETLLLFLKKSLRNTAYSIPQERRRKYLFPFLSEKNFVSFIEKGDVIGSLR